VLVSVEVVLVIVVVEVVVVVVVVEVVVCWQGPSMSLSIAEVPGGHCWFVGH
jgi:hypothetical protein